VGGRTVLPALEGGRAAGLDLVPAGVPATRRAVARGPYLLTVPLRRIAFQ